MEKPNFLPEKYPDLPGSLPVDWAVKKNLSEGKSGPTSKEERVDMYMGQLEEITQDETQLRTLRDTILNEFTIDTENEESLSKVAEGLYESEKRMASEQGRGAEVQRPGSTQELIERYKPLILEKAEIQRKTLTSWLNYLQENDAMQPMWFRYYIVRSLQKMGVLDKEKGTYSKRAANTVAAFPELRADALEWVYKRLTEDIEPQDYVPQNEEQLLRKEAVVKLIQGKDFPKLYAFAQMETVGHLNRESFEGEWRKYDQGSDFTILEHDLEGKGTGWRTATGSAKNQLGAGDFYVYYTKSKSGAYTEPRVAIRMKDGQVAEVRGINQQQELEPELIDVAQAQYHTLPGGGLYDKKAHDMKWVTNLVAKKDKGEPLKKEDLAFLYEIDSPVEGFGYEKDPRVEELQKARKVEEDIPFLFECSPGEIAYIVEQITPKTKVYIGKLLPGIFEKLPENLEYVFASFPGRKICRESAEIGGDTVDQLEHQIEDGGMKIAPEAKSMMREHEFTILSKPEHVRLVRLRVRDLGFSKVPQMAQLYERAKELGLDLCPPEVGPIYRLNHQDQPSGELVVIGMKQIADRGRTPSVFCVEHNDDGLCLNSAWARPSEHIALDAEFIFALSRKS